MFKSKKKDAMATAMPTANSFIPRRLDHIKERISDLYDGKFYTPAGPLGIEIDPRLRNTFNCIIASGPQTNAELAMVFTAEKIAHHFDEFPGKRMAVAMGVAAKAVAIAGWMGLAGGMLQAAQATGPATAALWAAGGIAAWIASKISIAAIGAVFKSKAVMDIYWHKNQFEVMTQVMERLLVSIYKTNKMEAERQK